jgi:MFS family permease
MGRYRSLLAGDRRAQAFFAAHLLSSLGNGAGYVGLLLLVHERSGAALLISLVLLADFLPAMVFGPVFGAAADRWSRKGCAVVADVARAVAFIAAALVPGVEPTIAFALLAGAGAGLFTPAIMAALPEWFDREKLPSATSLFGAASDLGWTAGPALAAGALVLGGPEAVVLANGVTFAVSAVVLLLLPATRAVEREAPAEEPPSLLSEAREGLAVVRALPGARTLVLAGAVFLLFGGMLNVAEVLLAEETLDAGHTGFSLLVAANGVGVMIGSLWGARGADPVTLRRWFVGGCLLVGAAMAASAAVPNVGLAVVTFALTGVGTGVLVANERVLLQTTVSERYLGRVFGIKDMAASWGLGFSFVAGGAIAAALGSRALFALSGAGCLLTATLAAYALRRAWPAAPRERLGEPSIAPSPAR